MQKIWSFSAIGWSTNSIALKCWLLWNKCLRKRRILMSKTSINRADGVANWSGVVNFLWTFHFQWWPKWHAMFITFFALWQWCNFSRTWIYGHLIFMYYTHVLNQFRNKLSNTIYKIKYPEEYLTVDKVGS